MTTKQPAQKPFLRRRWTVLLGGFLLSLIGGMSYAWGSFVVPLQDEWGWTATQATLPLTIFIVVFAVTMIPGGWLQDKFGPRKVTACGAALFFVGYGLASFLQHIPSPWWLIFSYGGVVGVACGLTYACIAPAARKWYADRPGFAVSTAVMGFGLGAVVIAPLKKVLIAAHNVDGTFLIIGVFVTIAAIVGAVFLRNPPEKWVAPHPTKTRLGQLVGQADDMPPRDFIRTPVFTLLWLALAGVIGGGLTAIGLLTAFGENKLALNPAVAALAISAFSLVNGLGRPVAGWLADRVGTLRVMILVYIVQAAVFLALPWVAVNLPLLIVSALLLGAGYAVTFALFPVLVAARFGTKYFGMNYGLVFSAFGLGSMTGLIGSRLLDSTGSFTPAFLIAGLTTVLGLLLLLVLRKKYSVT